MLLALLATGMLAGTARAETWYWKGGASGTGQAVAWTNALNWTNSVGENPSGAPFATTDGAVIDGGANQPLLNLAASSVTIASLTVGSTAASTLTFTNGYAAGNKLIVTGDATIGGFGTLTHPTNSITPAHWLALTVGNNMSIQVSGSNTGRVNVTGKGYPATNGPSGLGGDGRCGGSHGGEGGFGLSSTSVITPYDSITNPVMHGAGSAGTTPSSGGGVAVLDVGGTLTLDGSITADGNAGGSSAGGGAGGTVNVRAGTSTGSGKITANGGAGASNTGGGGGGGRIALVLTNANATFAGFTLANVQACGGLPNLIAQPGAAGTIYLKADGEIFKETLLVDNKGGGASYATTLFTNAIYRFDAIILTNNGILAVGTNAVLSLTNSTLFCDSTTNAITSRIIVNTDSGGKLGWPAAWTNRGTISFKGTNSWLSGTCNLTLSTNGILTHEDNNDLSFYSGGVGGKAEYVTKYHRVALDLTGDLTIDSGGAILVTGKGCPASVNPTGVAGDTGISAGQRIGGSHGGEGGMGYLATGPSATYGSVTNPVLPGAGGGATTSGRGGGLVMLKIDGTLTLGGSVAASGQNGPPSNNGGGAGGAVNIRARSLAGGGTVAVLGGDYKGNACGGGGGRIAIVLSEGGYSQLLGLTYLADGGAGQALSGYGQHGAAGTIYLKGADQQNGTLIVNKSRTPTTTGAPLSTTLFSTNVTDAVVGDLVLTNYAHLAVGTNATLTVMGNWNNVATTPGWTNTWGQGTVVLAGSAAATVWGSNTWYNLTITNAGKVVSFQANAIQFVSGTPVFSNNVTLQSTSNGVWWYLLKPGSGTQNVGVVTVRDSNATNGMTFAASGGNNLGNNVNWSFPAKGTLILLR